MSERKGLPWFAWVGIGCGVLLLLGVVAIGGLGLFVGGKVKDLAEDLQERPVHMTASAIAMANPEIELVEADEETKRVTMRKISTGEEMTFDLGDIQSGNFTFEKDGETVEVNAGESGMTVTTDEGTTRFGAGENSDLPPWLPVPDGTTTQVAYTANNEEESSGMTQLQGYGSSAAVLDYYRDELKQAGFKITEQNMNNADTSITTVTGQLDSPKRMVSVTHNSDKGEEQITVSYSGKN